VKKAWRSTRFRRSSPQVAGNLGNVGSHRITDAREKSLMKEYDISIIVPTYNRGAIIREFLQTHANPSLDQNFSCEIVVSNNASTDDTAEILSLWSDRENIRIINREKTNTPLGNMLTCAHFARGEYIFYLGDDDKVLWDGLAHAVSGMRQNENISVWQTSWLSTDFRSGKSRSFHINDGEYFFRQGCYVECVNFMAARIIFPEIGIYKREVFLSVFSESSDVAFWPFLNLFECLRMGDVCFSAVSASEHFYNRPGVRNLGVSESARLWDTYTGGLEAFFGKARAYCDDDKLIQVFRTNLMGFLVNRMVQAYWSNISEREFVRAYLLRMRLISMGVNLRHTVDMERRFNFLAALEEAISLCREVGGGNVYLDSAVDDIVLNELRHDLVKLVVRDSNKIIGRNPFSGSAVLINEKIEEIGDIFFVNFKNKINKYSL